MNIGFQFDVTYKDNELIELRTSAWNGAFGGRADVYVGIAQLQVIASSLRGFPSHPADTREVMFGAFGPGSAGGGVSMRFHCADGSGHAYVESTIESGEKTASVPETVTLLLPIEASAVDAFVEQLHHLSVNAVGTALLMGCQSRGKGVR